MLILVVDDESMVRSSIVRMINALDESYKAYEAEDGEEALNILQGENFDLVISDIRMPEIDGLQLAELLRRQYPQTRVVLLTGYAEFDYALSALRQGVQDYLLKPASREKLISIIRRIDTELQLERAQQQIGRVRENSLLEKRIQDLLYELPVLHADLALFPPHRSVYVFTLTADAETLNAQIIRFAMKNVLEDVIGIAGKVVVIVEERLITAVLFHADEALENTFCEQLSQTAKQTIDSLFRIQVAIAYAGGTESAAEISLLYMECQRKLGITKWANPLSKQDEDDSQHHLIRSALEWMEKEYALDLSLVSLAERLFVHPNYLSTLFKSETGATFTQHLTRIRLDKAKELLKTTHLKIYEICEKTGYADQAYFSKLFKASVGATPYEYRERKS